MCWRFTQLVVQDEEHLVPGCIGDAGAFGVDASPRSVPKGLGWGTGYVSSCHVGECRMGLWGVFFVGMSTGR